jgi:ribosomal protein S16
MSSRNNSSKVNGGKGVEALGKYQHIANEENKTDIKKQVTSHFKNQYGYFI